MFSIKLKSILLLSTILVAGLTSICLAKDEGQAGLESNFHLGFGARAISMGRAFTAVADDPSAIYWNPAGLESVYQQSFTVFYTTLYEGGTYSFISYAFPTLNIGTLGFAIGRIGIGGIPNIDSDARPIDKDGSHDEYQAFLAYAKKLPWNITSGMTVRVIRRGFSNLNNDLYQGNYIDYGVGFDMGFMYSPEGFTSMFLQNWNFGLNIHNLFSPQLKEGEEVDAFPLSIRFGILRKLYFSNGGNNINVMLDFDYAQDRDLFFNMGLEYKFKELGMLRAGLDGSSPTFGAGAKYSFMQIDYSFGGSKYSEIFSPLHSVSLTFNFGLNRDELYEIVEAKRRAEEERLIAEIREADRRKFIAEHMQKADEYFTNTEWLDAIVEYQQVISQDPFNNRAQIMIDSADVMLQAEFTARQNKAIEEALDKERAEINQQFVNERFERGRLLLEQKLYTEALIEFNRALERSPGDETILGAISTTRRRLDQEITSLLQASRREYQSGNYSEALRLLTDARLLGGDNAEIQNEIEILNKRYKLAQKIQQGLGLYEIGEYDQALQVFEQAMSIDPTDELLRQYYEKAKIETEGKTEELPSNVERRYLEGVDKFLKGKYKEAITIWEEIRKEYPYNKKIIKAIEGAKERMEKAQK
jgi:tetratricopeptide (TPR) repeat protein